MRIALIDGEGRVANVIIATDEYVAPEGFAAIQSDIAAPGDTWDGTSFHKPQSATPPLVPEEISDRQFFQQLAVMGIITEDEALAAVGPGTLPSALVALVNNLPADQRFPANMLLKGATKFLRSHPMVSVIGQAFGWSGDEIDDLWRAAAVL